MIVCNCDLPLETCKKCPNNPNNRQLNECPQIEFEWPDWDWKTLNGRTIMEERNE